QAGQLRGVGEVEGGAVVQDDVHVGLHRGRIDGVAQLDVEQERRAGEGGAVARVGRQDGRGVPDLDPGVGGGDTHGVVAGAPVVAAADEEGVEGVVARAADRDGVGARGQGQVDGRVPLVGAGVVLGDQAVAQRLQGVVVVQAQHGGDVPALRHV